MIIDRSSRGRLCSIGLWGSLTDEALDDIHSTGPWGRPIVCLDSISSMGPSDSLCDEALDDIYSTGPW